MAEKKIKIALAGNPNSGKTTLFNALTGSNQFVGNWPGVTVEKKEGKLKGHEDVSIMDLPGIYSLSPYSIEEVVTRNYLVNESPEAIINIVDGSNLERNLYLTTQLMELGIPVVVAINMMDVVKKNGDILNTGLLSKLFHVPVFEISALKETGIEPLIEAAVEIAKKGEKIIPPHIFSGSVEHALAHIEEAVIHDLPEHKQRWYSVKIFERDEKVLEELNITYQTLAHVEKDIKACEQEMDDEAEFIITDERYNYITRITEKCYKRMNQGKLTTSDKIDRIVTNRWLSLPIFALIMFLVYYVSVTTVGTWVTDWTNDGLFGDGFHIAGSDEYAAAYEEYVADTIFTNEAVVDMANEAAENPENKGADEIAAAIQDGDVGAFDEAYASYGPSVGEEFMAEVDGAMEGAPAPEEYGTWVPGVPVIVGNALAAVGIGGWVESLILDGIVAGVGAVLGFVPQMFVLFIFLAFLEACGYMSRVAFILDRVFRKFGLSGKSFIPMLIGVGCGVPGVMASRTIEQQRDRRMTIMTTTFIPCGAKLPIVAMIAAAVFDNAWWVGPSAYFMGIAAIICSGIILKKTKMFAGDPAPFVMELPAYHMPTVGMVLRSMWERGWSFIKKAGTLILVASVIVWFGSVFGVENGSFTFNPDMALEDSFLGYIGMALGWIFIPLGFGDITSTVATIMGLLAKEEVVAVFGVLEFGGMTAIAAYSFLAFNLLCAPCFAAIGAIKREMNSAKWTWFTIGYQCTLAYAVSLCIYQFGNLLAGTPNMIGVVAAVIVLIVFLYLLFRPQKKYNSTVTEKMR